MDLSGPAANPFAEREKLQATMPGVGQVLNFTRSLQVKGDKGLQIVLQSDAPQGESPTSKLWMLFPRAGRTWPRAGCRTEERLIIDELLLFKLSAWSDAECDDQALF